VAVCFVVIARGKPNIINSNSPRNDSEGAADCNRDKRLDSARLRCVEVAGVADDRLDARTALRFMGTAMRAESARHSCSSIAALDDGIATITQFSSDEMRLAPINHP
jgi:hypothetical protein